MSKYYKPKSLTEVIELLDKYENEKPLILAGGTDLMVQFHNIYWNNLAKFKLPHIIDINSLKDNNKNDIGKINLKENKIEIGALVTYTDILENNIMSKHLPIVSKASYCVGGRQVQNMGTIGGMLGTATPAADVTLALLVMDAQVELTSINGKRILPLTKYFIDYKKTEKKANEIITKVIVPLQNSNEIYDFYKVGGRRGQVIAITGFCGRLIMNNNNKSIIKDAYISVASAGPYSLRLYNLEKFIKNKNREELKNDEESLIKEIDKNINPIDEVIATAEYKNYAIKNLILDFILDRK